MAVTPVAGSANQVAAGGVAVTAIPAAPNGGYITNPYTATDQGIPTAEPLYVSPVSTATLQGNNVTFALLPGQTWNVIPGQTTPTSVNAPSSGHKFVAVYF